MSSRETAFLTQNIVFLVITFATMMGTLFRPLSEWIVGERISLNEPYFERVNGPIFAFLLILMGAAPLLAWRRSGTETLRRNFAIPLAAAVVSLPFVYLTGSRILAGYVGIAVLVFVFVGIVQEYVRGVRARRITSGENVMQAIASLLRRNGRRYGGYIVHLGVLMIALGIIGNEFYQSEGQANLRTGETINVSNYALTYQGMDMNRGPNYNEFSARIDIRRNGADFGQLVARQHIYTKNQDQPMTEVGLRPGLLEDVYVVLAGWEDGGRTASFKVYVNPLMTWMWIGGLMMILGVVLSTWPRGVGVTVEARAKAPAGAEPAN